MIIEGVVIAVSVLLLLTFLGRDKPPILGIYSQPGKFFYVKKFLFKSLLTLRNHRRKTKETFARRGGVAKPRQSGYGIKSFDHENDMDRPIPLDDHPHAIDTHYFNGFNSDGAAFILRIARRQGRQAEVWILCDVPGEGVFQAPHHPDATVYNTNPETISGGGLKFECLEPMRRWKITFNGLLRKGICNDLKKKGDLPTLHVSFSFIWEAISDVFDFDTDIDPGAVADAIAREKWTKNFWTKLKSAHQTHYEQQGEFRGVFKVEDRPENQLICKSIRDHSFGVRDWYAFYRYVVHFILLEDGSALHVSAVSLDGTLTLLRAGYMSLPNGVMIKVTGNDLDLPNIGRDQKPPEEYSLTFYTDDGKTRHLKVTTRYAPRYYHHDDWRSMVFEKVIDVVCDGVKGAGIAEWLYRNEGGRPLPPQQSVPFLEEPDVSKITTRPTTLAFDEELCAASSLVGGKGCQLAMLTQLRCKDKDFTVPKGICVTVNAFHKHFSENPELKNKLQDLLAISRKSSGKPLEGSCNEMIDAILKSSLSDETQTMIWEKLNKVFGDKDVNTITFAVRSSAIGEDGADLSSAGQMDTILGVKGKDKMAESLLKCWASNFSFVAVQYRRQHGQSMECSMGVVVQQMAPVTKAGVLFTLDPVNSDPGTIIISANYGLGESVVSGSSEPDTIRIRRTWDNKLTLESQEIGQKQTHIIEDGDGGIKEQEVNEEDAKTICLSSEIALRLAEIGVELEKRFSDPRDVEWGVDNNENIYLLQARPITTTSQDTTWQLIHEFDSPLANDCEWLTTANVGEMMPGAVTPLSLSTFIRAIDFAGQVFISGSGVWPNPHHFYKFILLQSNHAFLNLHTMFGIHEYNVFMAKKDAAALAVAGDPLSDFTLEEAIRHNGKSSFIKRIFNGLKNFRIMQKSLGRCEEWEKRVKNYSLIEETDDSHTLYQRIDDHMDDYYDLWECTFINSARSGAWSNVLMGILSQGKSEWTTEHYADVANLLSGVQNVHSADVPSNLQNLSRGIQNRGEAEEILRRDLDEATHWLINESSEQTRAHFQKFLDTHGHRCIREAEMRERSWRSDPAKLVRVIQRMLKVPITQTTVVEDKTVEERIAEIKSPLSFGAKLAMKFIVPKARAAVAGREWGKALSVQVNDKFKQAYWKLADLMVHEGRLPDTDLLFFLTHYEIGQLLRERNGKMVAKAFRRRKLLPQQMSLKFNKINIGHPEPIEENIDNDYIITSLQLKGTPVSQGQIKGAARVVTNLDEADQIQQGDILIVHYTDVGWAPYFPLISGLVTEIGGLISHGAVVAREYGLPCVVNMQQATSLFKTGDLVILDGTQGTLEKIES